MDELSELRVRLAEANIAAVSRLSGVSRPAIIDIRDGKSLNPGFLTVRAVRTAVDALAADHGAVAPGEVRA